MQSSGADRGDAAGSALRPAGRGGDRAVGGLFTSALALERATDLRSGLYLRRAGHSRRAVGLDGRDMDRRADGRATTYLARWTCEHDRPIGRGVLDAGLLPAHRRVS